MFKTETIRAALLASGAVAPDHEGNLIEAVAMVEAVHRHLTSCKGEPPCLRSSLAAILNDRFEGDMGVDNATEALEALAYVAGYVLAFYGDATRANFGQAIAEHTASHRLYLEEADRQAREARRADQDPNAYMAETAPAGTKH